MKRNKKGSASQRVARVNRADLAYKLEHDCPLTVSELAAATGLSYYRILEYAHDHRLKRVGDLIRMSWFNHYFDERATRETEKRAGQYGPAPLRGRHWSERSAGQL